MFVATGNVPTLRIGQRFFNKIVPRVEIPAIFPFRFEISIGVVQHFLRSLHVANFRGVRSIESEMHVDHVIRESGHAAIH